LNPRAALKITKSRPTKLSLDGVHTGAPSLLRYGLVRPKFELPSRCGLAWPQDMRQSLPLRPVRSPQAWDVRRVALRRPHASADAWVGRRNDTPLGESPMRCCPPHLGRNILHHRPASAIPQGTIVSARFVGLRGRGRPGDCRMLSASREPIVTRGGHCDRRRRMSARRTRPEVSDPWIVRPLVTKTRSRLPPHSVKLVDPTREQGQNALKGCAPRDVLEISDYWTRLT